MAMKTYLSTYTSNSTAGTELSYTWVETPVLPGPTPAEQIAWLQGRYPQSFPKPRIEEKEEKVYYELLADGTTRKLADTLIGHDDKTRTDIIKRSMEAENRRIGLDWVNGYRVSTVFLGMDHAWSPSEAPILFETMIFPMGGGESRYEDYQERYATKAEALAGHARAVEMVRQGEAANEDQ